MAKILVSDKLAQEGVDILKEHGFEVDCNYELDKEGLKKVIKDYEAIVIRSKTKLTSDVIEQADNLKLIGRAGVGVDNVDIEAATKKGIIVMNAPGGNTISTCEHAMALILAAARKIPFAYTSLKKKEWNRSKFKGAELYSKVLGVIGLGRIGKEVARRAASFGMQILAYDPFVSKEVAESLGIKLVELKPLLKEADFITVHTSLNETTKNMISEKEFSLMKKTAFIINCARGGIINEEDLAKALREKRIAGAALDVFTKEPPSEESPLFEADNLILTPHLGASTEEAQINVAIEIAQCVRDAFLNKAIRNSINYVQMDPETYRVIQPYMALAEKMGLFISQLIEGRCSQVEVSYIGEIASYKVDPMSMALAKGFLARIMEDDVNYINALDLMRERKIKFEQIKKAEEEEYTNSIRVTVTSDKGSRSLEGTLFSNRQPRFVKIDDFHMETTPSPYMVLITNKDKPGVIGSLGTTLGAHSINIAGMGLGRRAPQETAITILNIDSPLSEEVIKEITANSNIVSLKFIKL